MSEGRYTDLLKSFGFQSFLWTQFWGSSLSFPGGST
jgi:hypothetical protein